MRAIVLAALLSLATAAPAFAGTYALTVVVNGPTSGITLIKVDGGEATRPPPVREQKVRTEFSVELTVPDGDCFKRVSFFFGPGNRVDKMMDVCGNPRISIW